MRVARGIGLPDGGARSEPAKGRISEIEKGPTHRSATRFMMRFLSVTVCAGAMIGSVLQVAAETIELDCVIKPSEIVRLATAEPGLLARVNVSRGDTVEAGDLVAELVTDAEETAVALARGRVEEEAEIIAAESRVEMLRRSLERNQMLASSNLVSTASVEQISTELQVAQQDVQAARARQAQAALELQRAEQLLERRRIYSPVPGIVTERLLAAGEFFGETDHVATIAVLDPLHVESFASVDLFGAIREGETAEVFPEEPIGGQHAARVAVVDRVLDAASGTYGVRLELENPRLEIPAGVNCRVAFNAGAGNKARMFGE